MLNELLASFSTGEPTNEILRIDRDTRKITIPESEKVFGVVNDNLSEYKYFGVERKPTSAIDLATSDIWIVYELQDAAGDVTEGFSEISSDNIAYSEDNMVFAWDIPEQALDRPGTLIFNVHFHGTDGQKWHTTNAHALVLEGLVLDNSPDTDAEVVSD